MILDQQNGGVIALGILVELDVTLTIFIQFVKSFPVADARVARKLRDEVVEHRFGENFALAADELGPIGFASWVLYFLFSFALVSFYGTFRQVALGAELLKLRFVVDVCAFELWSKGSTQCVLADRQTVRAIEIDLLLPFGLTDRHISPSVCKLLHLLRQQPIITRRLSWIHKLHVLSLLFQLTWIHQVTWVRVRFSLRQFVDGCLDISFCLIESEFNLFDFCEAHFLYLFEFFRVLEFPFATNHWSAPAVGVLADSFNVVYWS